MSRRRVTSAGAVVLVLLTLAGWLVFYSSVLGLKTIEVRGAQVLSAATVTGVLAIPEGTPLARVDLAAAEAALQDITQIESATVSRDWPATLVVQLTERSALATVDVNGTTWLVDRFGVLFAQVSEIPPGVVALRVERPATGDRAVSAAIEVIEVLDPTIRAILVEIRAVSPTEIELTLTDGRTVIWGSAQDSGRKSQILAGLLAGGVVGSVYDVSSPTSAVIR